MEMLQEIATLFVILVVWILIQGWLFPRLGVPT